MADIPADTATLYRRLAPLYDVLYGALLQPGRRRAMTRLAPRDGERILEIGVGTGFGLAAYPRRARVVAIDLSSAMIARARARSTRLGLRQIAFSRMDGEALAFPDHTFDAVYAPYVLNVVPDPLRLVGEMRRVCRPGGRLVLLNHFEGIDGSANSLNRLAGRIAAALTGVDWTLRFETLFTGSGLQPASVERVNLGGVSAVVVCHCRTPPH
jgi:phosphatidylethanolamine/phosphatidyl-N-methylethanolamine N-methyltransferase